MAATSILAFIGIGLVVQPSAATDENSGAPTTVTSGVLRLRLGASDFVRFDAANGSGGFTVSGNTQDFVKAGKCAVSLEASPALMTLQTEPANTLGLSIKDALGIEQSGKGRPCGQVEIAQSITMSLGSGVSGKIDAADIAVEGKYNGSIAFDLRLGGSSVGGGVFTPGSGSDNGPDSNPVRRLVIDPSEDAGQPAIVWDTIVFRVHDDPAVTEAQQAFSLHGTGAPIRSDGPLASAIASDPSGTQDSVLRIVESFEGTLDCESNGSNTATHGESGVSAELTRGDNADDSAPCEPVVYDLFFDPDDSSWTLAKDMGNQAALGARFHLAVSFPVRPATNPPDHMIEIDYGDGAGYHPMEWCLGDPMTATSTAADPDFDEEITPASVLPTGEDWCILEARFTVESGQQMQPHYQLFGSGDPKLR